MGLMPQAQDQPPSRAGNEKLPRRLDKLVESGRLTADEADMLREAGSSIEAEAVLTDIRARHAGASLQIAVDAGTISQEEADRTLEQIRSGEHSPELRSRVRLLAQGGAGPDDQ